VKKAYRLLILASDGAVPEALVRAVAERARRGPVVATFVLPISPLPDAWIWDEERTTAAARDRVAVALALLARTGAFVEGMIGDRDPMVAVNDLMQRAQFDEVIISTPTLARSRWLRMDLPSRIRRAYGLPVAHVVADGDLAAPVAA
jgi:hypothetical protein